MSKPRPKPVDMGLSAEKRRRRRRQGATGGTVPAQLDHATNPRARSWTRDGQRKLDAMMDLRGDLERYQAGPEEERLIEQTLARIAEEQDWD